MNTQVSNNQNIIKELKERKTKKIYLVKKHPIFASIEEFNFVGEAEAVIDQAQYGDPMNGFAPELQNRLILKTGNKLIMVDPKDVFVEMSDALKEALEYTKHCSRHYENELMSIKLEIESMKQKYASHDIMLKRILRRLRNIRKWASLLPIFKFNSNKDYGKDD